MGSGAFHCELPGRNDFGEGAREKGYWNLRIGIEDCRVRWNYSQDVVFVEVHVQSYFSSANC